MHIVGVLEQGYPSIPNSCTGSCSAPWQGLPGDRQDPPWLPRRPFKNKAFKMKRQGPDKRILLGRDKAPARGACREETRPRQAELAGKATQGIPRKLAVTRPTSRQDPANDKLPDTTRRRPRQGACRGKPPLRARAPAHLLTCRSRTLPSTRGRRPCS